VAEARRGRRVVAVLAASLGAVTLALAAAHRSAHAVVFDRYSTKFLAVLLLAGVAALLTGLLAWTWDRLPPGRLGELALAGASAALAFAGFDLLLGRLWLAPSARLVHLDPLVHHRLQPGRHFVIWPKDYATWITVNADGYRGPQRPRAKPPGVKRVWLSGDSFTLGKGVADEECFAALVEKRLNFDEGAPRYEVLNGGVDSYAPLLEYLDLEARGFSFQPDLVVLAFDVSDLWQEEAYHQLARAAPDGTPAAVDGQRSLESIPRPVRVERWLRRHSYFWAWALRRLDEWDRTWERTEILEGRAAGALEYTFHEDQAPYEPQWRAVEESLGRVVAACRRRGVAFALVTYPWGHQVNATEWARGRRAAGMAEGRMGGQPGARRLLAFAQRQGVPFLDMTEDFRRATAAPLYFREDMHWTAAGHEVAAASLYAFLVREGLVGD
jgi:acetyltransferase AlgX (SGNH hydrolase-like protein)